MIKNISRRDFLKGAAVGAVGISTAGLLGVYAHDEGSAVKASTPISGVPQQTTGALSPGAFKFTGTDHTYGSILNPQSDFTSDSGDYSALFSPLKIGGRTMKNRFAKSSAGSGMQKSNDWPDDENLLYYEQFAKGGVSMICCELSTVVPVDMAMGGMGMAMPEMPGMPDMGNINTSFKMDGFLDISTDAGIPAHKAIADHLHKYDVVVLAQIFDATMVQGGGGSYSPNEKLEESFNPGLIQTTKQVQKEQQYFVDAAVRYHKAGYDGVEINASCNHYFSTFLSRISNNERTDQYSGKTVENRARIITEIIEDIRKELGNDFIIQVLYSGVEENVCELGDNSMCITIEEACEMAKLFEKAGASSLHIRSQAYGHHCGGFMPDVFHIFEHGDTGYNSVIDYNKHFGGMVIGQYDGVGGLLDVSAKIKSCVSIPVGAVGSMDPRLAPDLFNNAIKDGKVDFLLMNRPLMADASMVKKLQQGRRDEIAPCARCMTCFVAPFGFELPMYCRVNPALTRAYGDDMPEGYDPAPTDNTQKVIVIGGGPAGMEAARIAAQRGHKVSLYEKSGELGGKMDFMQKIKGTHERIEDHRKFLMRQLEIYDVQVNLDKEVDLKLIKSEAPDAVIVAVGGVMDNPDVAGSALTFKDLGEMMTDDAELPVGDDIVIIGGQFQACEVAVYFARQGKKVTMLNPGPESELYQNGTVWTAMMGKSWLLGKGVKIYHGAKLKKINASSVVFDTEYGITETIAFDDIINALPMRPNRSLFESISGVCNQVYAVGDCYSPNTIANATARAHIIARKVGDGSTGSGETLADNQFSATAAGIGDVTVTITVTDRKIVDVVVDTSNETAGIAKELGNDFAAQILENGQVDAISGATVTGNAVQAALEKCMKKAGLK